MNKDENVFWSHYTDGRNEALFPFGFELTYTTFNYDNLQVSMVDGGLDISIELRNTGDREGEEVVQLYIQDVYASLTRPILELKTFEKVIIDKGETKTVHFTLSRDDLSFYNNSGEKAFEPGLFKVSIGSNSSDLINKTLQVD